MNINSLDALIFDFDGVLTDNGVFLDQDGKEFVRCSRADGLAFDALRKLKAKVFILSTEKNKVVKARADKLKIPVIQGATDKQEVLLNLAESEKIDLSKVMYIGNDLNDYYAMKRCGYSACPVDSHKLIKSVAMFVMSSPGGGGVVRELLEDILELDLLDILYKRMEEVK